MHPGFARLFLILLAATLSPDVRAQGPMGERCRAGDLESCQTLCARGMSKACARLQGGGAPSGKMVEFGESSVEELRARGLVPTGLRPTFPKDVRCTPVASYFADRTRYDGSTRNPKANFGYHGGIDLSLDMGTPIVAIADGTVIRLREGRLLVGIELFLRHAPEDTGLGVWTFSKYKHFMKMPELAVGQRVRAGETVGYSGNTGTVGGYYGSRGYPHLHLSVYMNATGSYSVETNNISIHDGQHVDPLAFYLRRTLVSSEAAALPQSGKSIPIPFQTTVGGKHPGNSPVVWPVAYAKR